MRQFFRSAILGALLAVVCAAPLVAQQPTLVQSTTPATNLVLVPISATAAAGSPAVLTIPAPAGSLYNYVCFLAYDVSVGAGGTVTTNGVSTSTNFNAFAYKVSNPGTANTNSAVNVIIGPLSPTAGCVKSAAPGVSTTFTSPTTAATAFDFYATYFQAP